MALLSTYILHIDCSSFIAGEPLGRPLHIRYALLIIVEAFCSMKCITSKEAWESPDVASAGSVIRFPTKGLLRALQGRIARTACVCSMSELRFLSLAASLSQKGNFEKT